MKTIFSLSKKTKVRIYQISTSIRTRGGISPVVKNYLESDLSKRFEIIHITTHKDGSSLRKIFVFFVGLIEFGILSFVKPADIVHIHSSSKGSFYRKMCFAILARMFGFRIIFHIHSGHFYEFYENGGAIRGKLVLHVLNISDCIIVLTEAMEKMVKEISRVKKVVVLGNPISLRDLPRRDKEPGKRNGCKQVLYMGAIIKNKGVYDLISCIPKVIQRTDTPLRFVFAGDREIEKAKSLCTRLGISKYVEFPGWVTGDSKSKLLLDSDLLVLPSYVEGIPVVILEAMGAGLPVIATRVGGIPDIIKDGVNGILVPPGDVDRLTNSIVSMVSNQRLMENMGEVNRKKAEEELDIRVVSAKLDTIYKTLLL